MRTIGHACEHFLGQAKRHCGSAAAHQYVVGWRCAEHTPSAVVGRPEPPETRCPPLRCYCGESSCPAFSTYGRVSTPAGPTVVDARAVATGKRRARSLEEYRGAQDTTGRRPLADGAGVGKTAGEG